MLKTSISAVATGEYAVNIRKIRSKFPNARHPSFLKTYTGEHMKLLGTFSLKVCNLKQVPKS